MSILSAFLHITEYPDANIALIRIFWLIILGAWLLFTFLQRRKFFREAFRILENTNERCLLGELLPDSFYLEDKLYREMLRLSNKSVIEKIRLLEDAQKEYREYLESWVHEIKTPVSVIDLLCENAKTPVKDSITAPPSIKETLRSIRLENRKIENSVDLVLYHARSEDVYKDYLIRETDLQEALYEALKKEHLLLIQNHIRAEVSCHEKVYTDKKWIVFIINQLILNSVKYRSQAPIIRFYTKKRKDTIVLTIEDNGTGILPEDLPRIFEKGFTGSNGRDHKKATGMGLRLGFSAVGYPLWHPSSAGSDDRTVFLTGMAYRLHISFHPGTLLMTLLGFGSCYLLSLFRCRRKFKKMNIHILMEAGRKNEEIRETFEPAKRLLLPLSVLFILLFRTLFGSLGNGGTGAVVLFLTGLVITIYLFYAGLSAFIICYIRKKGSLIYKRANLFLLRQFTSKVRTMQFTIGTLTVLFTLALMGSSFALMLGGWQALLLDHKYPFDILLYSPDPGDTFEREITFLKEKVKPLEIFPYRIYTNGDNQVNTWMLTHLSNWGTMYQNPDGSPDTAQINDFLENNSIYCLYDTYMGLSDYNHLRRMLGYKEIELSDGEYAVQIKERLSQDVQHIGDDLMLAEHPTKGAPLLTCAGIYAEPFSQDGHNGSDYLIIVPDKALAHMYPYYSELALDIEGTAPPRLREELDTLRDSQMTAFRNTNPALDGNRGPGSDTVIVFLAVNAVKDNLKASIAYMLASVTIPLFYISLVFLCVAVTVLSVQQLSDSAKYKYRYDALRKLGLKESSLRALIFRQLSAYYLCPALLAVLISGKMVLFAGKQFVMMTGMPVLSYSFLLKSIALFLGIYLVYFTVTWISFTRNIRKEFR